MFHITKRIWVHTGGKEKGTKRIFLHISEEDGKGYGSRFAWEFVWGKRAGKFGFKLHFGNKSSETPFDSYIIVPYFATFFSAAFPGLGRFCEWLGHGHKRDISLYYTEKSLWWKLWFDDDMGYDRHHDCDSWRKPKLWPWSMGREKHRAWMCLRDGNISLNPLTAFWGHRGYKYEDVDKATTLLNVGQFEGDWYQVDFTLQKQTRARDHGPWWARRVSDEGYCADWDCKGGLPFRNDSWKGDCIYGSAEPVANINNWIHEASESLKDRVIQDRVKYRYHPPEKEPL